VVLVELGQFFWVVVDLMKMKIEKESLTGLLVSGKLGVQVLVAALDRETWMKF